MANSLPLPLFELRSNLQTFTNGVCALLNQESGRAISAAEAPETFLPTIERFYRQLAPLVAEWCGPSLQYFAQQAPTFEVAQGIRDYPGTHCTQSQNILAHALAGPGHGLEAPWLVAGTLVERVRAAVASWTEPQGRPFEIIRQLIPAAQFGYARLPQVRVVKRKLMNRIAPGCYESYELETT